MRVQHTGNIMLLMLRNARKLRNWRMRTKKTLTKTLMLMTHAEKFKEASKKAYASDPEKFKEASKKAYANDPKKLQRKLQRKLMQATQRSLKRLQRKLMQMIQKSSKKLQRNKSTKRLQKRSREI